MPFRITALFLFFSAAASSFSAERYVRAAYVEIPSLMRTAQGAGELSEKISPGSSAMIGAAMAALSFDSRLMNFDLTSPLQIACYIDTNSSPPSIAWLFSAGRKNKKPLSQIRDGEKTLHVREAGENRALISYDKDLLGSISSLPEVDEESPCDIKASFCPAAIFKHMKDDVKSAKLEYMASIMGKRGRSGNDFDAAKVAQVKLEFLEKLFESCSGFESKIKFGKDKIEISSVFEPVKDSSAGNFIFAQEKAAAPQAGSKIPMPVSDFSAAGRIRLTEQLEKDILKAAGDIFMELGETDGSVFNSFFEAVFKDSKGKLEFTFEKDGVSGGFSLKIHSGTGLYPATEDAIRRNGNTSGAVNFSGGCENGYSTNGRVSGGYIEILHSRNADSESGAAKPAVQNQPPLPDSDMAFCSFDRSENAENISASALVSFRGGKALINVEILEGEIRKAIPSGILK